MDNKSEKRHYTVETVECQEQRSAASSRSRFDPLTGGGNSYLATDHFHSISGPELPPEQSTACGLGILGQCIKPAGLPDQHRRLFHSGSFSSRLPRSPDSSANLTADLYRSRQRPCPRSNIDDRSINIGDCDLCAI